LDDLEEVLVGLHFLPRELRLERIVVCRCSVLAVLDEERLAQVLFGELALRDVEVEERELEVELLQKWSREVWLLLTALVRGIVSSARQRWSKFAHLENHDVGLLVRHADEPV
jgi:hypothetical protein